MTPQNKIPFRMSDCTSLRKIKPVQNHIKPELQHIQMMKFPLDSYH